jgi:PmbA protein
MRAIMARTSAALIDACQQAIALAKKHGATSADAIVIDSTDLSCGIRNGAPETIERAESCGIGLRAFIGQSSAVLSSSDMGAESLARTAENVVAMAKIAPPDPYAGLADPALLAKSIPAMELADPHEPSMKDLQGMARACEEAGRSVNGITNSEGGETGYSRYTIALVTSHGFAQHYEATHYSVACSLIAGEGERMQRDYDYTTSVFLADMQRPETIGRNAAKRTLDRLNPRKIPSQQAAIFFEPRVGKSLLGAFGRAISGSAVARKTSFLKDSMGMQIFHSGIEVIDDPLLPRGLGSSPFDAEGIAAKKQQLIQNGVLQQWLLDVRSANQLGLTTTGHASRGLSDASHPASTNLYIAPSKQTPDELFASVPNGLLVTETIGSGTNLITGDYSVGASGFWMENGKPMFPVSEITIAGNLKDMFASMRVGNDLEFRYSTNVPTIMIPQMTIAGADD